MLQGYARAYKKNQERGRRRREKYKKDPIKSVVKDVAYLKGLINTEFKYHDYQQDQALTSTGHINCINFVNQGDSDTTHDGSSFRIKSVAINGFVKLTAFDVPVVKHRLALVLDTDAACNTATPVYSDIYKGSFGEAVNAHRNLENRSRFVILKQWDFTLNADNNASKVADMYMPVDLKCQIVGTTASEANLRKNGLYIVGVSDQATTKSSWILTSRIRYVDN